jgi:hypothetical protein
MARVFLPLLKPARYKGAGSKACYSALQRITTMYARLAAAA